MKQFIVDAFTSEVFSGNPAAVCVMEEWLPEALMQEDTVIWASSRNTDFYSMDGSVRTSRNGHVMCFWKYENGVFFAKDPGLTKEQGNNVPYDEERMEKWLGGWTYQQFIIGLAK